MADFTHYTLGSSAVAGRVIPTYNAAGFDSFDWSEQFKYCTDVTLMNVSLYARAGKKSYWSLLKRDWCN